MPLIPIQATNLEQFDNTEGISSDAGQESLWESFSRGERPLDLGPAKHARARGNRKYN